ncbi:MAG: response regulator, partial [Candidatus Hodarchaeales archaeon]
MKTNESKNPIRVLHCDDEQSFLEMTKTYLEAFFDDLKIELEVSPTRALERIKEAEFDVIVSDYQMPELTGLELLEKIRLDGIETPFIMFTGKSREEVAIKALNLGADFYIQKGSHIDAMFKELHHYILKYAEYFRSKRRFEEKSIMNQKLIDTFPNILALIDGTNQTIIAANKASKDIGAVEGTICHEKWFGEKDRCPWCLAPIVLEEKKDASRIITTNDRIYVCHWIYISDRLYMHYIEDVTEKPKLEVE